MKTGRGSLTPGEKKCFAQSKVSSSTRNACNLLNSMDRCHIKPETTGSSSLWISCSFIRGKGAYASLKGDTKIPPALLLLPRRMLVALSSDASGTALLFAAQVRTCCHVAMLLISPFFARDLASFAHIKSLNKVADLSDVYITAIYNNSQLILILGSIACYNHESQRFRFHVASNCHMKGPSEAEGGSFLLQFLRLLGVKFSGSSLSAITWCLADPPACMPIHTNIYLSI